MNYSTTIKISKIIDITDREHANELIFSGNWMLLETEKEILDKKTVESCTHYILGKYETEDDLIERAKSQAKNP